MNVLSLLFSFKIWWLSLIALLRLEPNGHMGAQVTAVGCLVAPTHYSGQRDVGTGMMHHHNAVKALFAGFRSRGVSTAIPSPSWALSVTEVAAPCCLIVRLILACSVVQRSYAALRRTRTPQGASVRLFLTHACCSPMLCCRIQA